MNRAAIACSAVLNAAAFVAMAMAGHASEPRVAKVATTIAIEEAVTVPSPPPPGTAAREPTMPRADKRRGARARTAAERTPGREIVFVPDPPTQARQPPPVTVPDVIVPAIPRADAPGIRPLPHQTASIVPEYDWAQGDAGAVRMRVGVQTSGKVSSVEFLVPSGIQALDAALAAAIRGRSLAPCLQESGEPTECTVDYRFDYQVTRHANGVREARTCGHVEDGQPSCCDSFER